MRMNGFKLLAATVLSAFAVSCGMEEVAPPEPFGAVPTEAQLAWQRMEMNMFCHFGPNTFTDKEWGDGTEAESLFAPTALDCCQWVAVAKAAGMKGIVLTAKHHDGFCLWPNPESRHTVRESAWRDGKGDVLGELAVACADANLKMGIYISPWDRHAPDYGTPDYNATFVRTLESAYSYGDIFEQWFDGANGEGPNGKHQVYDWPLFNATVARLQPNAVVFSDVGPGCRWVGNEEGRAGETCWSTLNTDGFEPGSGAPSQDTLNCGNRRGSRWVPAETDVSIRPGWFWHASEQPKTLQELLRLYYTSVGRNSLLLLNVPPDRRGLIPAGDSLRLVEFRHALDRIFATDLALGANITASNTRGNSKRFAPLNLLDTFYHAYWAVDDSVLTPSLVLTFDEPVTFNRILLQEYVPLGQRVAAFHVEYRTPDGTWRPLVAATTIGYKRILCTPTVTADALQLVVDEALACPVLNRLALFMDSITSDL